MGGSSKKQTVGYKYSLGVHMPICHGPIDKITRIRVANKVAFEGEATDGQIAINKPKLFGGEDKEGGISGNIDLEFGAPDQLVNDYLASKQTADLGSAPGSGQFIYEIRNRFGTLIGSAFGDNPQEAVQAYYPGNVTIDSVVQISDDSEGNPRYEVKGFWIDASLLLGFYINSTLTEKEFAGIPAYRGITAAVLRQVYLGTNPYLKPWEFRAQRIHTSTRGAVQWYDEKSEIQDDGNLTPITDSEYFDNGLAFETDDPDGFSIAGGVIKNTLIQSFSTAYIRRITEKIIIDSITFDFRVTTQQALGDTLWLDLRNESDESLFQFLPWASTTNQADHKASFHQGSGWTGVGASAATINTWYSASIVFNYDDSEFDYSIAERDSGTPFASGVLSYTNTERVSYLRFNRDGDTNISVAEFDNVVMTGHGLSGDMNPAHIIRECLTDTNWGLGYTASDIDDTAFTLAADTLFTEEFGISLLWSQSTSIEDFIRDILRHIDGALYVHPRTGKFTLVLIRDDYVAASLPVLDESNIISISDYKKPTIGELTNYVTVKYWDRSTSEDSAISVQDIALAQQQGSVVSADVPMPGITRGALASRVASRELAALSNPLITCTIIANREAASLNIGDAFKLTWPKFGLSETIMRVTNAQFGTLQDGRVKLECVQDVFGLPQAVFSEPTDSNFVTPTNAPANSPFRLVQEANYWTLIQDQGEDFTFDPLDGYLLTAATTPSADALNYRIWTDESGSYVEKEPADFCPTATITHDFPRVVNGVIQTVVGITGLDADDIADIDIGSIAQIGNEFLEVVSVSTTSLTVGRAVVDTPIEDHVTGDRIFFWGNSFYGFSATLYQDNDTIGVKITPATAQGQLDVVDATEQTLTFDQRAYRAWLPGNLAIGGSYFPSSVEGVETVDSSWAHRDRTLQTAGLNDFTEASIGPEVGTTYTTTLTRVNTSVQLDQNTGLTGTTDSLDPAGYDGLVRFEIVSVRDALDSYHTHSHEFIVTRTSALQEEQGLFLFTEDNEAIITES